MESLRNEHLNGSAQKLVALVAEQGLRLRIHGVDDAGSVDDDDAVWCNLQEASIALLL